MVRANMPRGCVREPCNPPECQYHPGNEGAGAPQPGPENHQEHPSLCDLPNARYAICQCEAAFSGLRPLLTAPRGGVLELAPTLARHKHLHLLLTVVTGLALMF